MGAGKRPAAEATVGRQPGREQQRDVDCSFSIGRLAYVVVALTAVRPTRTEPAQKDVAHGLHELLTLHDALGVVAGGGGAEMLFKHRVVGLLRLQQQGIAAVPAVKEDHPVALADAADADHLAGHAHVVVRSSRVRRSADTLLR